MADLNPTGRARGKDGLHHAASRNVRTAERYSENLSRRIL
jgi:hypothetical protein